VAVELRPGPASMAGLEWLARVGPAPMDAWACAMGWGDRVARSHAGRLERAGWLVRQRMMRGDGSLLIATRRGVRMTRLPVSARSAMPEPALWAHDGACAWTAAWFTVRGAPGWQGPREVLVDPELKRVVQWSTRSGLRQSGHRPDLTVRARAGRVAVEVELERKSAGRLEAILTMYRRWISEDEIAGVAYVCATEARAASVSALASKVGIPSEATRFELLSVVREEAQTWRSRSAEQLASAGFA
jgi:hypothetical protein